ncbi:TetR/AcrR family transcriptional regulator [Actinomycetes bacterium KLBMP 9759]
MAAPSMSEVPEDRRVVRSRAIILTAATAHFAENGFVGANVDVIAQEAGVSKRTVYNLYDGKEQLFRAVMLNSIGVAERFSRDLAGELAIGDDLAADLERIGVRLAAAVLGGRVVALRRLLIGEVQRFPELAREYYERAPRLVMRTLAERFAELAAQQRLRADDPALAAEHFAFLVMGATLDHALFELEPQPGTEDAARAGVAVFLRAYT